LVDESDEGRKKNSPRKVSADKSGIAETMARNLPDFDVYKNCPYKYCPYVLNVASDEQMMFGLV